MSIWYKLVVKKAPRKGLQHIKGLTANYVEVYTRPDAGSVKWQSENRDHPT